MPNSQCPFCTINPARTIGNNDYAMAIFDGFPISPGHTLIIPKRHVASLFEVTAEERDALFDLLADMRRSLIMDRNPDGFNIGINEGAEAGQTVMHLHIHSIPRYTGDIPDPRGGIRWIFQAKLRIGTNDAPEDVHTTLERKEISGSVTIKTMRQAAEAMDCVFVYALLPHENLSASLRKRAEIS